jgi:hypothetical protein
MIVTHKTPYREGELRLGWASWDDGSLTERSVKYAYRDASGKISRGAPEISLDMLVDMLKFAAEQGGLRLSASPDAPAIEGMSRSQLQDELRGLNTALLLLQRLSQDFAWARSIGRAYDEIGARKEAITATLKARRG